MADRLERALGAWREATAAAPPPPDLAVAILDAVERPRFADVLWGLRGPTLLAAAVAAAALAIFAVTSVQTLAREAADYAMTRAL